MIRRIFSLIGFIAFLYFVIFVPIGELTTWQHLRRIWATDEAQHMSDEMEGAIRDLEGELQERLLSDAGVDADADAGEEESSEEESSEAE